MAAKQQWTTPEVRELSVSLDTAFNTGSGADGTAKSIIKSA